MLFIVVAVFVGKEAIDKAHLDRLAVFISFEHALVVVSDVLLLLGGVEHEVCLAFPVFNAVVAPLRFDDLSDFREVGFDIAGRGEGGKLLVEPTHKLVKATAV